MRLRWFEDMDEDENRSYDMEEPNFFEMCIRDSHPAVLSQIFRPVL